jgi:hypothetical protein
MSYVAPLHTGECEKQVTFSGRSDVPARCMSRQTRRAMANNGTFLPPISASPTRNHGLKTGMRSGVDSSPTRTGAICTPTRFHSLCLRPFTLQKWLAAHVSGTGLPTGCCSRRRRDAWCSLKQGQVTCLTMVAEERLVVQRLRRPLLRGWCRTSSKSGPTLMTLRVVKISSGRRFIFLR